MRSSDPDRIVSFVNPSDQIPMIQMDEAKISIDAVKDGELNRTGENKLVNIDIDSKSRQPGIREVPIAKSTIEPLTDLREEIDRCEQRSARTPFWSRSIWSWRREILEIVWLSPDALIWTALPH